MLGNAVGDRPQNGVAAHLERFGQVAHYRPEVERRVGPVIAEDLLRGRDEGPAPRIERVPRIVAEEVLPQVALDRPDAPGLGVELGP